MSVVCLCMCVWALCRGVGAARLLPTGFGSGVDPRYGLGGAAHEEEGDAEQDGDEQHGHGEARDDAHRQARTFHDHASQQHPHSQRRQVHRTWGPTSTK